MFAQLHALMQYLSGANAANPDLRVSVCGIFVMRVSNGVLEFTDEGAQQEWGHGIITAENAQNTSLYQFGEFMIQGPAEPEQYLATYVWRRLAHGRQGRIQSYFNGRFR